MPPTYYGGEAYQMFSQRIPIAIGTLLRFASKNYFFILYRMFIKKMPPTYYGGEAYQMFSQRIPIAIGTLL